MPEGQAVAWVTVPELRRLGLLPTAVSVPGMALQRAKELRGKRFPFAAIARWLDSEGLCPARQQARALGGADVAKLLRQAEGSSEDLASVSPASAETAGLVYDGVHSERGRRETVRRELAIGGCSAGLA